MLRDVENSLRYLALGGTILIHDLRPVSELESSQFDAEYDSIVKYWTGDVWRSILSIRSRQDVDLAILDVDWGLGVLRKRPNPRPLNGLKAWKLQSDFYDFMNRIDQITPFLSLHELHYWLENETATAGYVRLEEVGLLVEEKWWNN